MNERIKQLAEQAGAEWDDKYHWYVGNEQMKKFAQLIVRECIRLCDQVDLVGADDCIDNIKEHFGVE